MMSKMSGVSLNGDAISLALDPHRRRSVWQAMEKVLARGGEKRVALVGFQAATFFAEVAPLAREVVILEGRRPLVEKLQKAIVVRELGAKVRLVEANPERAVLESPVDVAVYLPQSTWMMEGPDAAILVNIRKNVLKDQGTLLPRRVVQLLELADSPTSLGGISLREPRYSRPGEPVATLSESKQFMSTDYGALAPASAEVDDTIIVRPLVSGRISALRLTSLVELVEGVVQVTSEAGIKSIIVPLREDVEVRAGQPVSVRVRYEPGQGLRSARFSARVLAEEEIQQSISSDHRVVREFQEGVRELMAEVDKMGRGADLDRVVAYTRRPHGDVSRLTAVFWAVDEEFRRPLSELVEEFRRAASKAIGQMPSEEAIYDWMLQTYEAERGL